MIKHNCPNCNSRIAFKWLFLSSKYKTYKCISCNYILRWNRYRTLSAYVGNLVGIEIIIFTKDKWFSVFSFSETLKSILIISVIIIGSRIITQLILPNPISANKE